MIGRLRRALVERYWARRFRGGTVRTWIHEPVVRRAVNRRITGDPNQWPLDAFRDLVEEPFELGLSLGCGDGRLERDLLDKGLCRRIEALDLSREAVERSRHEAEAAGWCDAVTYRVGDMNALDLPTAHYDIAFFHQSLHHVSALEHCLDQVQQALRPGGRLYLDEYIGPSRDAWTEDRMATAEAAFARLPESLKRTRRIEPPIERRDPSEAVRSGEIVEQVEARFRVLIRRDYGGHLLALLHPFLDPEALKTPEGEDALRDLVAEEDVLLEDGAESFYAVILAE